MTGLPKSLAANHQKFLTAISNERLRKTGKNASQFESHLTNDNGE
jgi:hypothetical protein